MQGDGPLVVREKFHAAEPMSIDQALFEMELVGHDFFLFSDVGSGMPSVVYRRRGYQYGVNASSKNKEAAIEFVRWMSSPETQLRFATQIGLCPTRSAVLDDPKIAQEQPFMQQLKPVFIGAIGRPVTPKYPQVTLVLQSEVSRALTSGNVKAALQTAKDKIQAIVKT